MLTREQQEFFAFFGMTPPAGMSADGARRFMDAYLRDTDRQRRWQQRPGTAVAAPAAPAATQAAPTEHAFRFTGAGGEYFGIWIVNLLLTIVTLGIYSAWAKVRRLQYFYRHTELAEAAFDYHGEPLAILKGRAIALVLFLLYNFSFSVSQLFGVATLVLLGVALPWLLRNSFRFRLRYSSYRGLRFRFAGSTPEAYWTFLARPIVVLLTLYLAVPWFHQRLKQYQHGSSRYGKASFAFGGSVGAFYREYLVIGLLMLAVLGLPVWMMVGAISETARIAQETGAPADPTVLAGTIFTAVIVMVAGLIALTPLFQARLQNLVWNNTTLGPHRFRSAVSAWRLFVIHLTNALLLVVTLGFYAPWAAVRVARYRVEALSVVTAGSLEDFLADQAEDPGAAGEETAELFDIDIAL